MGFTWCPVVVFAKGGMVGFTWCPGFLMVDFT